MQENWQTLKLLWEARKTDRLVVNLQDETSENPFVFVAEDRDLGALNGFDSDGDFRSISWLRNAQIVPMKTHTEIGMSKFEAQEIISLLHEIKTLLQKKTP